MNKKLLINLLIVCCFIFSGCSSFLKLIKTRLPEPHKINEMIFFQLDKPGADNVQIVGDWNDWGDNENGIIKDPKIGQLKKNSQGIWQIKIKLSPGRHIYKFVINQNSWIMDPNNRNNDGNGNSLIIVE